MYIIKTSMWSSVALFVISFYLLSGMAHANGKQTFDKGVRLFGSGEYAAAARLFEQALKSDANNPVIYYNLGSSYYKLGSYTRSKKYFEKIDTGHNLAAFAYYNLGLIAFRLDGRKAAIEWFQRCLDSSDDRVLSRFARKQIKLLQQDEDASSWRDRFSSYFSVGGGYDNNVSRVSEDILNVSSHGSGLLDVFLSSSYWINGDYQRGNALKFGGSLTRYSDLSEYSSDILNIGLYHYRPIWGWKSRYGIHYYHINLDGEAFQQRIKLQARVAKKYSARQRLRLQYEYSRVDELDAYYSYLAGSQHRLRIENRTRFEHGRLRLGYVFEINDKQNYQRGNTFSSYSPVRQTFYFWYKPSFGEKWTGRIGMDYRQSDYVDENIVDGTAIGVREDERTRATVGIIYNHSSDIELELSLRHIENSSNLAEKEYVSNQILFTVGRYF